MIEPVFYLLLGIGLTFNFLGAIGLHRFPDVYTRLHAATKCTTFGSLFIAIAIILYSLIQWYGGNAQDGILAAHTFIALIALLVTNPTGAHALARGAHRGGIKPKLAVIDELEAKK